MVVVEVVRCGETLDLFADGLDMGCEGQRGVTVTLGFWACVTTRMELGVFLS